MSNSRIFYGLQNVSISTDDTAGNLQTIRGVQSVGTSSTTNIETFSSFGSIAATSILQDMDLEITMEVGIGSWTTALSRIGYAGFSSGFFDTTKKVRITYDVGGTTKYVELNAILTSYSAQLGTDGPATESLTFQNAGNAGFGTETAGTTPLPEAPSSLDLCGVFTRPDMHNFHRKYRADCCSTAGPVLNTVSNATSWSISMDASNEKVSVLGQSMPFGKFASFPVETSMEVEMHLDPSSSMGSFNSGSVTSGTLADVCYDPTVILGPDGSSATSKSWNLHRARQSGQSRSGGDVGGGNVTVSESYTGYNDLGHDSDLSTGTTEAPSA
tara:strand:+ start:2452 stop:3435 length:984 start_codon:yes stop_codon:yes gene_type:complete